MPKVKINIENDKHQISNEAKQVRMDKFQTQGTLSTHSSE